MLIRADALRQAGGIDAIRNALIDDCALAAPAQGARARSGSASPRASPASAATRDWATSRRMVSRSAYAQLGYSPWHACSAPSRG